MKNAGSREENRVISLFLIANGRGPTQVEFNKINMAFHLDTDCRKFQLT